MKLTILTSVDTTGIFALRYYPILYYDFYFVAYFKLFTILAVPSAYYVFISSDDLEVYIMFLVLILANLVVTTILYLFR